MTDTDPREGPSWSHEPMTRQTSDEPQASVELASMSHVGKVRSANEDSCEPSRRDDGTRLLVVADGMGGHRGGATASSAAVATILETFETDPAGGNDTVLREAIESANARIFEMAQSDAELEGMGTTVVAFVLDARHNAMVAHVGDSRCYRYRRGHLEALTTDHSVVAEMQRRGLISAEEAAVHPRRNEILRSVGVAAQVEVEVRPVEVAAGDRFVLCSDGLSGVVSDDEIATIVSTQPPEAAVEALISVANERGGPDNITVQILSIPSSLADRDPETTEPIELSETGIDAVESRRRRQEPAQRIGVVVLIIAALIGLYLLSRLLRDDTPNAAEEQGPVPVADRFEIESQPPRRGIPR